MFNLLTSTLHHQLWSAVQESVHRVWFGVLSKAPCFCFMYCESYLKDNPWHFFPKRYFFFTRTLKIQKSTCYRVQHVHWIHLSSSDLASVSLCSLLWILITVECFFTNYAKCDVVSHTSHLCLWWCHRPPAAVDLTATTSCVIVAPGLLTAKPVVVILLVMEGLNFEVASS